MNNDVYRFFLNFVNNLTFVKIARMHLIKVRKQRLIILF